MQIIKEYFERSKRKKEDEAWLKKYKVEVLNLMGDRPKADFDDIRVSVTKVDSSYFDLGKIYSYLEEKSPALLEKCTKRAIDEEKLQALCESGDLLVEELQEVAWVEKANIASAKTSNKSEKRKPQMNTDCLLWFFRTLGLFYKILKLFFVDI